MGNQHQILAICRQHLQQVRGAVRAYNLYKSLEELGVRVTYLDGWNPTFTFDYQNTSNWLRLFGLKVKRPSQARIFLENVHDPNVIKLLRKINVPIVVDVRDDYNLHAESMGIKSSKRLFHQRELSNLESFAAAQTILLPSQSFCEYYSERYDGEFDDKFVVIMNASDPYRFRETPLPQEPRIGLVGGANPGEGWELLLEAAQLVKEKVSDLSVHIAYNVMPQTRKYAESLIEKHSRDWVHFYTDIAYHSNAPDFYSSLYAVVIPRRSTKINEMATPSKLFDAMASARPLVVTECREQARIVARENCGLVCPHSVEGMANAIIKLLENRSLAEALGKNGRAAVIERHNWQERGKTILSKVFCHV